MPLQWNKSAPKPTIVGFELGRSGSVFLVLRWQKEEKGRHKKEEEVYPQLCLQECWPPSFGHAFSACLLSVFLCAHPYDSLYRFRVQSWNYIMREYHVPQNDSNLRITQLQFNIILLSTQKRKRHLNLAFNRLTLSPPSHTEPNHREGLLLKPLKPLITSPKFPKCTH
ncbi:hypothetical protein HU200_047979 [Digitaria exilis]|uniref:Uncharacterized protein n=1 Tax=Digitaria exilis TaxID=1010633 RepID=A0A835EB84_9POAL|nr:hypothetical protein HU200_047979 [Digitaria exilis]